MTEFWFVWREGGEQAPKYRHDDLGSAQIEAERLATLKPGERFIVLHAVGSALLPKPKATYEDADPAAEVEFPF